MALNSTVSAGIRFFDELRLFYPLVRLNSKYYLCLTFKRLFALP